MARLIREIRAPLRGEARRSASPSPRACSTAAATSTAPSTRSSSTPCMKRARRRGGVLAGLPLGPDRGAGAGRSRSRTSTPTPRSRYPNCLVRELHGREIHRIMEDVADNLLQRRPVLPPGRRHAAGRRHHLRHRPAQAAGPAHLGADRGRRPSPPSGATRSRAGRASAPRRRPARVRRRRRPPARARPREARPPPPRQLTP